MMRHLGCIGTSMKYNLASTIEQGRALAYLAQLVEKKVVVDVKEVKPRRSLPQNRYLHLLLGYFGQSLGYTREEAKMIYKQLPGNKDVYVYEKDVGGKPMTFVRSSAELTKEEMTKTIDVLRDWSNRLGYPLPTATDKDWLMQIENEIESNEAHL